LAALADVPVDSLAGLLDQPHAYAGRHGWPDLMLHEVVPRLPRHVQAEATRRIHAALDLPPVPPSLVHGDLAGQNVRWHPDGTVAGVIDWDLAQPFDPALDAARLAWHGWENVRAAVDSGTYARARTRFATFGIEQVASALDNGEPAPIVADRITRTARWIEATTG
jgi:aminoglycoside phosphotransferase (APT) family kinase protein